MTFVIQRDDGQFVAKRGSKRSYTNKLQEAQTFTTRSDAECDACDNERVLTVEEAMR